MIWLHNLSLSLSSLTKDTLKIKSHIFSLTVPHFSSYKLIVSLMFDVCVLSRCLFDSLPLTLLPIWPNQLSSLIIPFFNYKNSMFDICPISTKRKEVSKNFLQLSFTWDATSTLYLVSCCVWCESMWNFPTFQHKEGRKRERDREDRLERGKTSNLPYFLNLKSSCWIL